MSKNVEKCRKIVRKYRKCGIPVSGNIKKIPNTLYLVYNYSSHPSPTYLEGLQAKIRTALFGSLKFWETYLRLKLEGPISGFTFCLDFQSALKKSEKSFSLKSPNFGASMAIQSSDRILKFHSLNKRLPAPSGDGNGGGT